MVEELLQDFVAYGAYCKLIEERRAGDVATCYSSPKKAEEVLGWKA